jgi:hypothetical protein
MLLEKTAILCNARIYDLAVFSGGKKLSQKLKFWESLVIYTK